MDDLNVELGADISKYVSAMNAAGGSTEKFSNDAAKAVNKVSGNLDNLQKKSYTARFAVQNLGNAIRDIPFAAANPAILTSAFEHLTGSFTQLKQETGTTKGALQAFAQSLKGGGGILIGVNLALVALGYLADHFLHSGKASNEASDEIKKFNKTLDDTKASGIATGLSLQGFVNIAKDQTQSLETRNHALEQANKILGDHGDKLTLVNIATQAVTDQINKFTQATIQQALATKFSDRAADLIIKQRDAFAELRKEQTKLFDLQKKPQTSISATGEERLTAEGAAAAIQTKKVLDLAKAYDIVAREGLRMSAQLSAAQLSASQLFGSLDGTKNITGIIAKIKAQIKDLTDKQPTLLSEKAISENVASIKTLQDELDRLLGKENHVKQAAETINDVLSKLSRQLGVIGEEELIFKTDKAKEKISAINSAIGHLVDKFKQTAQSPVILNLEFQAKDIQERSDLRKLMPDLISKDFTIPVPLEVTGPNIGDIKKVFIPISKELAAFQESVAEMAANVANSFGQAVTALVTGSGGLGSVFQGILGLLGDFLIDFGKSAIKAGALALAIKQITKVPQLGIAAGIAAIVLGNIIKAVNLPKGFATGGFVSGPGTSTSDSIPARLSKGEYIINAKTVSSFGKGFFDMINGGGRPRNGGFANGGSVGSGSIGGGMLVAVEVTGKLRGKDIYISNVMTGKTFGRNG